jgi:hypothetical protein
MILCAGSASTQAWVGLHQAPGHSLQIGVGLEHHLAAGKGVQFVHPLRVAFGSQFGLGLRHAKAFHVDEFPHAVGTHPGVHHHHMATHAVAEQIDRRIRAEVLEQKIQIGHVVRVPVVVGGRAAAVAKTTPIGGDDVALLTHGVHHELERCGHVHPAMHHDEAGHAELGLAPNTQVVTLVTQLDELALAGA